VITLVAAIFLASLLGSLHCVGMCGAFLGIACAGASRRATQFGYHAGRLATYVGLGGLAGALGRGVDLAGALAGLQPIALTLAATTVTLFGVVTWMRLKGIHVPRLRGLGFLQPIASRGYDLAMRRPPVQRAMIIGLLTTLLPCGWMWTFLITAAGTARPATAMLAMFVFWLGTLPAMLTLGAGLRGILGTAQRRVPTLTCAAMIAIGLTTVAGRWRLDPAAWAKTSAAATTRPIDVQFGKKPPCCEADDVDAD
jgi:sulfite exporter TauE/SafE